MWVYQQRTGKLFRGDTLQCVGYSGFGGGKNEPTAQNMAGIGPIPQGAYLIGSPSDNPEHGPLALHLLPLTGTNTFGRSAFLVHGDSIETPGAASHGCIISPRQVREAMYTGQDKLLVVVSGNF